MRSLHKSSLKREQHLPGGRQNIAAEFGLAALPGKQDPGFVKLGMDLLIGEGRLFRHR